MESLSLFYISFFDSKYMWCTTFVESALPILIVENVIALRSKIQHCLFW